MSRDGGAYRRAGLTVALALAGLAVVPAIASAAAVSTSGSVITYAAASSETNVLTVTNPSTNTFVFDEASISITESSANCTAASGNVTCSGVSWTSVVVNLNDNDDTFTAAAVTGTAVPFTINGGDGDDGNIIGSSANDTINGEASSDNSNSAVGLSGGPGNDTIDGGSGSSGDIINGDAGNDTLLGGSDGTDTINGGADNDTIDGGTLNDTITGGDGNDTITGGDDDDAMDGGLGQDRFKVGFNSADGSGDELTGGAGVDRADYSSCATAVAVTIDGTNNDGGTCGNSSSAGDDVHTDVESVTGTTLGDTITGSCFANTFAGDPGSANGDAGGNDILNGDPTAGCTAAAGSTDFFGGGEGNDTFNGDGTIDGTHFRGFDTVTYGFPYTGAVTSTAANCTVATVNYAVRVTFDDVANDCDGFGNTTDNVNGDIERLIGSGVADNIDATAADQAVSLFGRVGNDVLTDSAFGDFLNGEGGADTINCPNGGTDTYVIDGSDTVTGTCEIGT